MSSIKKAFLFFLTALFLSTTVPASAHDISMGASRWCFGKDNIVGVIELGPSLMEKVKGIKEGGYDLASCSDKELRQIATDIIQPYLNAKLSISINGKVSPVNVAKIEVAENVFWKIWVSVDNISFNNPANPVKIDYRLLFEETGNAHVNLGYMYLLDPTAESVQKIFDYNAPLSQTMFDHNAASWELSINGPAQADKTARPTAISVSDKKSDIPALNGDVKKPAVTRNSAAVTPELIQSGQFPGNSPATDNIPSEGKEDGFHSNKPARRSVWADTGKFIVLGIEHILTGYDHIAFLLALIVIGLSVKEVLKIVTAFTVAHSITLLLAALQIVSMNSSFVETVIALSICYVALENLFRKEVNYRWLVTFAFGLIHGFGFATVLQELITVKSNLVPLVLSFNMGVEIGQLMIFLVMLPILHLLKNKIEFRKITAATSVAIFLIGFTWLIERVFDLKLLSF